MRCATTMLAVSVLAGTGRASASFDVEINAAASFSTQPLDTVIGVELESVGHSLVGGGLTSQMLVDGSFEDPADDPAVPASNSTVPVCDGTCHWDFHGGASVVDLGPGVAFHGNHSVSLAKPGDRISSAGLYKRGIALYSDQTRNTRATSSSKRIRIRRRQRQRQRQRRQPSLCEWGCHPRATTLGPLQSWRAACGKTLPLRRRLPQQQMAGRWSTLRCITLQQLHQESPAMADNNNNNNNTELQSPTTLAQDAFTWPLKRRPPPPHPPHHQRRQSQPQPQPQPRTRLVAAC